MAENVASTRKEMLLHFLEKVKALDLSILGVISNAQDILRQTAARPGLKVLHQVCHFSVLRGSTILSGEGL